MLKFEEYEDRFKQLYPNYTEEQLREVFDLRLWFRRWIVENFELFYN